MDSIGPMTKISAAQNKRLSDYLVKWCKDHNMSAHRLCTLMRINSNTISHVLSNNPVYYPTYRVVQSIANWLNISVDKLIGDRDEIITVTKVQGIVLPDDPIPLDNQMDVIRVLQNIVGILQDIRSIMRTTWMDNKGE